ncbi:hypothetical protein [Halorussus ruber]|uniref:hypothetical protein n=1 Tax=Halorussus ruber TaxID=1126238 RepID=UPI001093031D|nr:hypothetical protein [Halorussus ruber]
MAADLVHYHHPEDHQFSLGFVNPDTDAIEKRLDSYEDATETRVRTYNPDEEVYVIYTKTNEVADTEEIEYDFDRAFAEMGPDTRVIVRYLLDLFDSIQKTKREEESVPLGAYKSIEISRIPAALERVDWSRTVPEVGGQLASNVILWHALPNANHRTAFGMFEGYANASSDSSFRLPSLITDSYEWQTLVDGFVVDSKRLLTVRRNVAPFRYLAELGCRTVRRKGGIEIPLCEYDLELHTSEALSEYASRHEQRTVQFAATILKKTGNARLTSESGLTKSEFAGRVRQKI